MSMTPPLSGDDGRGVFGRLRRPTLTSVDAPPPIEVAPTDVVTLLPTRARLTDWIVEAIENSRPHSRRAVLAFVDIGQLRDVNDTWGADVGDELLRDIGRRLCTIDLPNTRVLRYEGAEFAIIFEQVMHGEAAEEIARFLLELLGPSFPVGPEQLTVTPTVGAALSTDNYNSVGDFIGDAHAALVRARDRGAGTFSVHDETKRGRYETRIDESRLTAGIRDNEFLLVYQPVVRLDTRGVIGFEALLRWSAPGATNTGMLFPRDFMPMLEKSGQIVGLGAWVVQEACRQAAAWSRTHPDLPPLFMTCNVSARQLVDRGFPPMVLEAVEAAGLQTWQLCLDITEQALRYSPPDALASLRTLKDAGVKLGLDDFGTGVSSLSHLRTFPLDLVRVDRLFVEEVDVSDEDQAIVRHIAALAHDLGLVAVAEGVERESQATKLQSLGVDLAQGFHFGRPEAAGHAVERLTSGAPST
jgi:diguanylate cyclase (GGDEF)-like protein